MCVQRGQVKSGLFECVSGEDRLKSKCWAFLNRPGVCILKSEYGKLAALGFLCLFPLKELLAKEVGAVQIGLNAGRIF